jgi:5S rRNA maturation endonuclease (ribonuclease M5)
MKKNIILLSVLIVSCSPTKMINNALTKVGILDEMPTVKKIAYRDKEIYFVEMKHLAKQAFYDNVLAKVDSFKKEGFFVLAEKVQLKSGNLLTKLNAHDSAIILKARKIVGFLPTAYSKNELLRDIAKDYNLVDQPMIVPIEETKNSKIADAFFDEMITRYEAAKGNIILTDCDYKTSFKDDYKCETVSNANANFFQKEIVSNYRDTLISKLVINQSSNKILMIYGKAHYEPIKNIIENIK